jgi:hypothetical protein
MFIFLYLVTFFFALDGKTTFACGTSAQRFALAAMKQHRQAVVCLVLVLCMLTCATCITRSRHNRHRPASSGTCHAVRGVKYVPSEWEVDWMARVDSITQPCAELLAQQDRVAVWLAGATTPSSPDASNATVFSYFEKTCVSESGKRTIIKEPIEPLVGHLRHPHTPKPCTPPGQPAIDVQSRAYITLLDNSEDRLFDLYPGRKILIDAGTSTYDSSLHWFVQVYGERGIHFDTIYAWEARPMDATRYWAAVPDDIKPVLHFFNAPITTDPASRMNPITLIKDIAEPGDFVAFKLDIDNDDVESAIMAQLAADDCAIARIAEMFFEKHYASPDMAEYFGMPPVTLAQATRNFAVLRGKGLRLHYWP